MSVDIAGQYHSVTFPHSMNEHGYSNNLDEFIHMGTQFATAYYSPAHCNCQLDLLVELVPLPNGIHNHSACVRSLGRRQGHTEPETGGKKLETCPVKPVSYRDPTSVVMSLDTFPRERRVSLTEGNVPQEGSHGKGTDSQQPSIPGTYLTGAPPTSDLKDGLLKSSLVEGDMGIGGQGPCGGNGALSGVQGGEDHELCRGDTLTEEDPDGGLPRSDGAESLPSMPQRCLTGGIPDDPRPQETGAISKNEHQIATWKNLPSWLLDGGAEGRKLSDPGARSRKEWVLLSKSQRQQRSHSDSRRPNLSAEDYECKSEDERESSAQGYDSGYHDEIRSKSSKALSSPLGPFSPAVSDSEGPPQETLLAMSLKRRRPTPTPTPVSRDERFDSLAQSPSEENSFPLVSSYRAKGALRKHNSLGSIEGTSSFGASSESVSVSMSLNELLSIHSIATVTDYLSSLGFDDFNNPQLIPDRFIPKDIAHAKPSLMRQQTITGESLARSSPEPDVSLYTNLSPSPAVLTSPVAMSTSVMDLPLGATAENFLSPERHLSPPPPHSLAHLLNPKPPTSLLFSQQPPNTPLSPFSARAAAVYTDPSISQFDRSKDILETVPEETASDLSPSPRWHSPRVSIDHSVVELDKVEGKLGTGLAMQMRKRSLPQRDGHRLSIGSQVESEPESIYFSVTSYDDEITKEKEKEREELTTPLSLPGSVDDCLMLNRRRRRGVYTPPQGLLTWLNTQQETINEEDMELENPDELPWPFSEQVRLRKSLTEIKQAQEASTAAELTANESRGNGLHDSQLESADQPGRKLESADLSFVRDECTAGVSSSSLDLSELDSLTSPLRTADSVERGEQPFLPLPPPAVSSTCSESDHKLEGRCSADGDSPVMASEENNARLKENNHSHLHKLLAMEDS